MWKRTLFWLFLALNCAILAGGFLLSAAGTLLGSVLIGLIWSTGRIPWRYLTVAVSLLAFFNLGKFTMRERYWGLDGQVQTEVALLDLPRTYTEAPRWTTKRTPNLRVAARRAARACCSALITCRTCSM